MGLPIADNKWRPIVSRGALFSLIWWSISGGAGNSWWFGVPVVILAVIMSVVLQPPGLFVWSAFLRFVLMFFVRSLVGGVDVAWRAFHPGLPISPKLIRYPLQLRQGLPQVFMANTVSLLPGTLSAELKANCLQVHVLNERRDYLSELVAVEHAVSRIFSRPGRRSRRGEKS